MLIDILEYVLYQSWEVEMIVFHLCSSKTYWFPIQAYALRIPLMLHGSHCRGQPCLMVCWRNRPTSPSRNQCIESNAGSEQKQVGKLIPELHMYAFLHLLSVVLLERGNHRGLNTVASIAYTAC